MANYSNADSDLVDAMTKALVQLPPTEQWTRIHEHLVAVTQELATVGSHAHAEPVKNAAEAMHQATSHLQDAQTHYSMVITEFAHALGRTIVPAGDIKLPTMRRPHRPSGTSAAALSQFYSDCREVLMSDLIGPIRTSIATASGEINTCLKMAQDKEKPVPPAVLPACSGLITLHASLGLPAMKQLNAANELHTKAMV